MPKPTPEEALNDRLQEEIESLRNHNTELLAELKAAKTTAKQLTTQVETLTGERDQAVTTLQEETVSRPARALIERMSNLPEYFEAEFKKRGYQFVHTAQGIVIHDAEGNVPLLQDHEGTAPRPCNFTAADLSTLVMERWKPAAERHPSADTFASMVRAPHISGGGARDSGPGGRGPSPAAPTPAAPSPPALGLR
jgi:hypothetical protein